MSAGKDRPLSARLVELGAEVASANRRARKCAVAHRATEGEVARLRDAVLDAFASEDEARAAKASRERDKAEGAALRDSAERLEGAQRAVQRAGVERSTFAVEHIDGLVAEREPDAVAAAQAV